MPELPEIEILKNEINAQMVGKEVTEARLEKAKPGELEGKELLPRLRGAKVEGARRRGKFLILDLGGSLSLMIHLWLAGQVLLVRSNEVQEGQSVLTLFFNDGYVFEVRGVGLRSLHLIRRESFKGHPAIAELGIDALSSRFTLEQFRRMVGGKRKVIKALLMDQALIAGLGNTYVNELLFSAKVHPAREAQSLSEGEVEAVYQSIRPTLERGIEWGGSSTEQFVHLDGSPGHFQEHFQVNRREGESCLVCATPISKMQLGGRATYFCPNCQPKS